METLDYERDDITSSDNSGDEIDENNDIYDEEENEIEDNNEENTTDPTKKKKKKKHPKKMELTDYDKLKLSSNNEDLMKIIKKELEDKKMECVLKLQKLNKQQVKNSKTTDKIASDKTNATSDKKQKVTAPVAADSEEVAKQKKYLQTKIRKYKKALSNQEVLKSRLNLLKVRLRKTKTICKKLETKEQEYMKKRLRCFNCRRRGHLLTECREAKVDHENKENNDYQDDASKYHKKIVTTTKHICYNCGGTDHTLAGCEQKVDLKSLKFAECFICHERGHISAHCPLSDKGIYPHGGKCFVCGENDHLAKNCPQKQMEIQQYKEEREKDKLEK